MDRLTMKLSAATAVYSSSVGSIMLFQSATNYIALLPPLQLVGLAGAMSIFAGFASYYWELRKYQNELRDWEIHQTLNPDKTPQPGKEANLKASLAFSGFAGTIVAFLSYDRFVVQWEMVTFWIGLIGLSAFSYVLIFEVWERFVKKRAGIIAEVLITGSRPTIHTTDTAQDVGGDDMSAK